MWLRFLGDPVKNNYREIKDINKKKKKKEVSRRGYLSMFYYQTFFVALIHSPLAPQTQISLLKTLDMLVNDRLDDSYAAQHWR